MSGLAVPLIARTLQTTGDILLRAELDFLLRDRSGNWQPLTFRVDSGTEMTSIPADVAKLLDLPFPQQPMSGLTHGPTGQQVRAGVIRAQVVGMDGTEYIFPCYFLGDPDAPPDPNRALTLSVSLLGLTGVVDKIRITLDGTPTPGTPNGNLVVEKL